MKTVITALLVFSLLATSFVARADNPTDFKVKSAVDDSTFELSKHKGKIVVLHFLLKTECPYCMRYTHDYAALVESNPEVVHVFLKPDSTAEIKAWAGKLDKDGLKDLPRIYRDVDAELADKFRIPDGYRFHGQSMHFPALLVLDEEARERFRFVGKSNSDRMSTEDFLAKLAELQEARKKSPGIDS